MMTKNTKRAMAGLLVASILSGCGQMVQDSLQNRALDGAKLIAAGVDNGLDPSTFNQPSYTIDATHRLLIRYESLMKDAPNIRTDDRRKVELLVAPQTPADLPALQKQLAACPLKRNWMMEATWRQAHPFNKTGRWAREGGDFDPSECVQSASTRNGFAVYDVTTWFTAYVRGRNVNFGFILTSDAAAVAVAGDASGYNAPQLDWTVTQVFPGINPTPTPTAAAAN